MTYANQFPDFDRPFDAELLTLAGWRDASWGNDSCPSFSIYGATVFLDYASPALREFPDALGLINTYYETDETGAHMSDLGESFNSLRETLAAIYKAKIGYDPFADDPNAQVLEVARTLAVHATIDHFAKQGFDTEVGGGWSEFLSCYLPSGWHVWLTGEQGGGMPSQTDWCVCVYPKGWEGAPVPLDIRSSDEGKIALSDAVSLAIAMATGMEAMRALYERNLTEWALVPQCARDLLADPGVTGWIRAWLSAFADAWDWREDNGFGETPAATPADAGSVLAAFAAIFPEYKLDAALADAFARMPLQSGCGADCGDVLDGARALALPVKANAMVLGEAPAQLAAMTARVLSIYILG